MRLGSIIGFSTIVNFFIFIILAHVEIEGDGVLSGNEIWGGDMFKNRSGFVILG